MRWLASVVVLGAVVALAMVSGAGCGSSGSGRAALCDGGGCGDAAASVGCDGRCWRPTPDDEAFAAQLCSLTADCCTRLQGSSLGAHTKAEHAQTCSSALLEVGFSRDPELRAACLAEVAQAAGTAACMAELWPPNPSAACGRLLAEDAGPVATGQRCAGQGDCQTKTGALAECALGGDALAYCSLVTPGKAGDPCVALVNEFFYEPVSSTERTGHYCSAADRLICRPSTSSSNVNVCRSLFADGSDCYRNYECASGECLAPPLGSGLPAGTCATSADPRDLSDGASCADDKNCKSTHCTNGQCQSVAQYADYHTFCTW